MKIYTKTGDQGETGLLGGIRVSKSHLAITCCGSLDEANSNIGLARSTLQAIACSDSDSKFGDIDLCFTRIQHDLFDLGSQVASSLGETNRAPEFPAARAVELERDIDKFESELSPLTAFILPGGSQLGSLLHLARSVCRRAERDIVALIDSEIERSLSVEMVYLNRLGDLLFVLARVANKRLGQPETTWKVGRGQEG